MLSSEWSSDPGADEYRTWLKNRRLPVDLIEALDRIAVHAQTAVILLVMPGAAGKVVYSSDEDRVGTLSRLMDADALPVAIIFKVQYVGAANAVLETMILDECKEAYKEHELLQAFVLSALGQIRREAQSTGRTVELAEIET